MAQTLERPMALDGTNVNGRLLYALRTGAQPVTVPKAAPSTGMYL